VIKLDKQADETQIQTETGDKNGILQVLHIRQTLTMAKQ
jgi:hypothetical protein